MRLVRVGVVDGGHHGDLARVVERLDTGQRRVPTELRVVCQRQGRRWIDRDPRAQLPVAWIGDRDERVEPVVAAVEVDRYENPPVGVCRRLRRRRLEQSLGAEPRHRRDRESEATRTGEHPLAGDPP